MFEVNYCVDAITNAVSISDIMTVVCGNKKWYNMVCYHVMRKDVTYYDTLNMIRHKCIETYLFDLPNGRKSSVELHGACFGWQGAKGAEEATEEGMNKVSVKCMCIKKIGSCYLSVCMSFTLEEAEHAGIG